MDLNAHLFPIFCGTNVEQLEFALFTTLFGARNMNGSSDLKQQLQLGSLFEKFKRLDKAEDVYRSVIARHPGDFRAYFNCAQILASNELHLDEACTLFAKVIELDESIIEAYGSIAAVLIKMHRPAEAVRYCQIGLSKNMQDRTCLYNMNVALRQVGSICSAISTSWCAFQSMNTNIASTLDSNTQPQRQSEQHKAATGITVVCVKWGKKYGPDYVNNLYNALMRHQPTAPGCQITKVVCFTDDSAGIDDAVVCIPFGAATAQWHGWWLKAQVFAPNNAELTGWVLYIDLDTVICSSLDFLSALIAPDSRVTEKGLHIPGTVFASPGMSKNTLESNFYTLSAEHFQNEGRAQGFNSSMMMWHADNALLHTLFSFLENHYTALLNVIYKFDHYIEMMLFKHQAQSRSDIGSDSAHIVNTSARTEGGRVDELRVQEMHEEQVLDLSSSPSIVDYCAAGSAAQTENNDSPSSSCHVDKFCYYIQDVCPGAVIDYFALKRAQNATAAPPDSHTCWHCDTSNDTDANEASTSLDSTGKVACVITEPPCIVCFPLKPKPHELLVDPWIQEHWIGAGEGVIRSTGKEVD